MKNALFDIIGQTEEKYIARSEKRFKPHKGGEITAQVLRIVGVAASVILIISFAVFMWIVAEKHRDPVASTDTAPGTAAVTSPDTDIPATDTEAVTDPATDVTTEMTTDLPEEDFETEVKKMLSDYKSKESKSFLFKSENVSPAFDIAAKVYSDQSANEILRDNAAHFIYDVMREDRTGDLLFYNGEYHWGLSSGDVGRPYILLLDHYLDAAKKAAEGLSAECVKTRAYRTYSLLCASGYEFYKPGDTESRIVDIYERALTLYNAVWGGKPIIDGNTVKITKPYPAELQTAVKEYWGDTDRVFYTSDTLNEKAFRSACQDVCTDELTDMLIGSSKYFIIVNGNVYMIAADENDKDASPYYFSSVKDFSDNRQWQQIRIEFARTDGKGNEFTDRFYYYTYVNSPMLIGECDLSDEFILKRTDFAIEYMIDLCARGVSFSSSTMWTLSDPLLSKEKDYTFGYLIDKYFNEPSEKRRAAISTIFYKIADDEVDDFVRYTSAPDSLWSQIGSGDVAEQAGWLQQYADAAKTAAKDMYEDDFEYYYPNTYKFLTRIGFDGFKNSPKQPVDYALALVRKLRFLYHAVQFGHGMTDKNSAEYRVQKGDTFADLPEEAVNAIMKYYISEDYFVEFAGGCSVYAQTPEFEKIDSWYEYFSDVLPKTEIKKFIGDGNELFMISDSGTVYTFEMYYGTLWPAEIYERTVRVIEEKDGCTVIGFICNRGGSPTLESKEYTVNVRKGSDGYYVDGGSFIDVFIKNDIGTGSVADSVSNILRAHALIYNGETGYSSDSEYGRNVGAVIYANADELPEELKQKYSGDEFPVYSCVISSNYRSCVTGEIKNKMLEDSTAFKLIRDSYCLIIPSQVKLTNTAKACKNGDYSIYNVEKSMKVISSGNGKMTVSLDFVRTENGKSASKTYTFEFEYIGGNAVLTGGSFVNDVLMKK